MRKQLIILALGTFAALQVNAQNWEQTKKIVAYDREASDAFGSAVAISGNHIIVRAHYEEAGNFNYTMAGSVYFIRRSSDGTWINNPFNKRIASDRAPGDLFGYSVAMDVPYAIVGAFGEDEDEFGSNSKTNAGSAYIFEANGAGNFFEMQKIVASDRDAGDAFGLALSINGVYAVVGAPYEDNDLVGGDSMWSAGSAYVFKRDSLGVWNEVQKLIASDRQESDNFGQAVGVYGNYIVVSSQNPDSLGIEAVYIFEMDSLGYWLEIQKISGGDYIESLAISKNRIIVGSWNTVSANIFELDSFGVWYFVQKIEPLDQAPSFGGNVDISGDLAIVSASFETEDTANNNYLFKAGAAYVFQNKDGGVWKQVKKLVASDRDAFAEFGADVAIDGNSVIVGAHFDNKDEFGSNLITNAGSAYIFETFDHTIRGNIYRDANLNCISDAGEQPLEFIVKANQRYASANALGEYRIGMSDSITYSLEPVVNSMHAGLLKSICPTDYIVNLTENDPVDTSGFDFGFDFIPCPLLTVSISSNRRRRCENNHTFIKYCNKGFADTSGVKVYVKLPEFVGLVSADRIFSLDSAGNMVFNIQTLIAGQCGVIHLVENVECVAGITGRVICSKAWITPANSCADDLDTNKAVWDRSSIIVTGSCTGDSSIHYVIRNNGQAGTADMQDSSQFRIYVDNVLRYSDNFKLDGMDSFDFSVAANGQTVRVEADQRPGHPGKSKPRATIEACGNGGQPLNFGMPLQVNSDDDAITIEEHCLSIVDSYDPNDKQVQPAGISSQRYVPSGTLLDYQIRFQNTGSDTAYKVVVVDSLSEHLDISTIQYGVSSHEYTVQVVGEVRPVLIFTFIDIYLPDSTADELNSQGWIKFKIAPSKNLTTRTEIHNSADIYFDFNVPVTTNDAWVTVFDTTFTGPPISINTSSRNDVMMNHNYLTVHPNPFSTNFTVTLLQAWINEPNVELVVIDVLGRVIDKRLFDLNRSDILINAASWMPGLYFLELKNKSGLVRAKLIKSK